jgi:GTP-binding protein HflX
VTGLKPDQINRLTRLYNRRFPPQGGYSLEQARELALLSEDVSRQIGLVIDRKGRPVMVVVGEHDAMLIPELTGLRSGAGRLSGVRFLLTRFTDAPITSEDLMDMVFLRLDSFAVLSIEQGMPHRFHWAHLLPSGAGDAPYMVHPPLPWDRVDTDFTAQVESLEEELARTGQRIDTEAREGNALLVSVGTEAREIQESRLEELADLAHTAGLEVVGRIVQRVGRINPKHILGKGKLAELEVLALQHNVAVIVFEEELSPTQMRNLSRLTERKILDRTQLILDIFAQHAVTKAGKLQVELAQLKYTLPRLVGRSRAMSRLAGGIGGRGPGETKLELDRRKIRDRIGLLKGELKRLRKHRQATRSHRARAGVPIVALVGYTNAGKSTLLNTLTHSGVLAENKLFATLDPTSRRLRFPEDREIILTDTVGFIRKLPEDLKDAFMATLEELEVADLLVQVADAAHPEVEAQVEAVDAILNELGVHEIPRILVLNKDDLLDESRRETVGNIFPQGVFISARQRSSLTPLVEAILSRLP